VTLLLSLTGDDHHDGNVINRRCDNNSIVNAICDQSEHDRDEGHVINRQWDNNSIGNAIQDLSDCDNECVSNKYINNIAQIPMTTRSTTRRKVPRSLSSDFFYGESKHKSKQ
jgi:hypothetical protein